MKVAYLEVGSLAGNVKEMLGYVEPLHLAGYEVKVYFQKQSNVPRVLSFSKAIKKLESSVPRESFVLCSDRDEVRRLVDEDIVIGGSTSWTDIPKVNLIKTITPILEADRALPITYFAPTRTLADSFDVMHIPRGINFLPFYNSRQNKRKYDITCAAVMNVNKRLDVLEELSKYFKVKVAVLADYEYQLDMLKKLPNLNRTCRLNARTSAVADLFGKSKIFCLPSVAEKASIALDEAMCAGCYPLATDVGSFREQTAHIQYKKAYVHSRPLDNKIREIESILDMLNDNSEINEEIAEKSFRVKHRIYVQDKWLDLIGRMCDYIGEKRMSDLSTTK